MVRTLGVRPDLLCYSDEELDLLRSAQVVLFPTWRYLHIFEATGRPVFPSYSSYHLRRSPYLQHLLARHLNIPKLRARAYAGRKRLNIPGDFDYPFAVWPVRKRRPLPIVVRNEKELKEVCKAHHFILVVEMPDPVEREVQIVTIGRGVAGWKGSPPSSRKAKLLQDESLRYVTSAGIDYGSVRWIKSRDGWKFSGLLSLPLCFVTPDGLPVSRHDFLCSLLRDIAAGRVQPPWKTNDRAT
ncbi:hypothetical protein [Thermodesulforhabdus norvegica]|uniref:hypothetical protein n=1 Tax=Thermodesulforhabdus norvegica TaxID=39841 RepID=UPI00116044F8|nr:hypothetical protein [Thermodesulforhabdus norvegica]